MALRGPDLEFSSTLYDELRKQGFTQRAFAAALGVNPATVSQWITGGSRPSIRNRARIEQLLWPSPSAVPGPALTTSIPHTLRRGMVLDRYSLVRRLGRGASADVWLAEVKETIPGVGLSIGQQVALKIYLPSLSSVGGSLRIQREFLIATELTHPNLVDVFDVMISPSRPFHTFLAMEFVDGPTLKNHIARRGPLSVGRSIEIGIQLFAALEELHAAGALHRDVKAANIILDGRSIKLMDFGIVTLESDSFETVGSMFLGSKHSAPLEQLTGGVLDERADIYAAGTVLYHCLMGRAIYQGAGPEGAIVVRMLNNPETVNLRTVGRKAAPLKRLIDACLEVNRDSRPETASECLRALQGIAP